MNYMLELNTTEDIIEGKWDTTPLNDLTEEPDVIVVNEHGGAQSKTC
ncbi:hypothetical protein ACIBQ5_33730 [Streptomyces massasporeus]